MGGFKKKIKNDLKRVFLINNTCMFIKLGNDVTLIKCKLYSILSVGADNDKDI